MDISTALKAAPAALIGLTVHEYAHALAAYKLGDKTAQEDGRLTLNPVKHIDPLGLFLIIIAGFGWAKPVSFNPDNLKRKHLDQILIALAGPFSNALLAILLLVCTRILYAFAWFQTTDMGNAILNMLIFWSAINFGLFIFNLIPIPPLDGSHVYMTFLRSYNQTTLNTVYRYGTFVLLAIIIIESRSDLDILPIGKITNAILDYAFIILRF